MVILTSSGKIGESDDKRKSYIVSNSLENVMVSSYEEHHCYWLVVCKLDYS